MKRFALGLLACLLLVGCSTDPASQTTTSTAPGPAISAPSQPTAVAPVAEPGAIPTADQVCLKPEDKTGVSIDLYKPAGGDSAFRAKPGWAVARLAQNLHGTVFFPKGTDLTNVKVTAEPSTVWKAQPATVNVSDAVAFRFAPNGDPDAFAAPGWITLTIDGAKNASGKPLSEKPLTLKIYGYTMEQGTTYQYLGECWGSLVVPSTGP